MGLKCRSHIQYNGLLHRHSTVQHSRGASIEGKHYARLSGGQRFVVRNVELNSEVGLTSLKIYILVLPFAGEKKSSRRQFFAGVKFPNPKTRREMRWVPLQLPHTKQYFGGGDRGGERGCYDLSFVKSRTDPRNSVHFNVQDQFFS